MRDSIAAKSSLLVSTVVPSKVENVPRGQKDYTGQRNGRRSLLVLSSVTYFSEGSAEQCNTVTAGVHY